MEDFVAEGLEDRLRTLKRAVLFLLDRLEQESNYRLTEVVEVRETVEENG